jgi:N-acetylneuraminate synthase
MDIPLAGKTMGSSVQIRNRWIGEGDPCFIIAEAGSNHDGSFEQANRLIDVAAWAGADAVKFQVFRANRLYPRSAGLSNYLKVPRPIYEIITELEMPYEWIPDLASYCRDKDILFLASVFDEESADRLEQHVGAFKIASYEMTHIPLVRHVAKKGKPVIISTGTANLSEVAETVHEFRETGNHALMLMQCTAAYPAPLEALNVRAISTMKEAFGVPVGLSDHSRDPVVGPLSAVAVGANLIEKHVTLSNALPGPDHRFAVEPDELRLMIERVREVEKALGSGRKEMHPVEEELRWFARRSVFAVRDIQMGELLTEENIAILRCGALKPSLEPKAFRHVIGKRARRNIPTESPIQKEDYE